ncbi:c-type cytochrome [bacterium]|nr:c-type cytochrome [bacterium]MBU1993111.1 c-type cytochrome [bacterium]
MRKIVAVLVLSSLSLLAFDNEKIYKECSMCHGKNGDKTALNSSPQLSSLSEEELTVKLKRILDGTSEISKKYLSLHKMKLKSVSEDDVAGFASHIHNLK